MELKDYLEGMTQQEFADMVGCSQGLVSQWLAGNCRITAERAVVIEKVTGGKVSAIELRPDIFGQVRKMRP